jgi:hypothetical protein
MSLIKVDLFDCHEQTIYVLMTKKNVKIVGVYMTLSVALKSLYLADEVSILSVTRANRPSKPCINDTYDCLIGSFYFKDETLIYKRNLTGEIEKIVDEKKLIAEEDFRQIENELNQIEKEQNNHSINKYHDNAHIIIDEAISKKFSLLSNLTEKFNKYITIANFDYGLNLDYDLSQKANQLYQEINGKMDRLTIEEKVSALVQIKQLIQSIEEESQTLIEMMDSFVDHECESNMIDSAYLSSESDVEDESEFKLIRSEKHNGPGGQILYSSPLPSPPLSPLSSPKVSRIGDSIVIDNPKMKSNKKVEFDLEKNQVFSYQ